MSNESDPVEIRVRGAKPGTRICALFLGNAAHTFVMHIDRSAFAAISGALQGARSARPSTHLLLRNVLAGFDAALDRVVIEAVKDGVFRASMRLVARNEIARKIVEVDARPSDAIAMALLMRRPILCAQKVMRQTPDMTDALKKIQSKGA